MRKSSPANPGPIPVLHVVHWPRSGITSFLKNLVRFADPDSFAHSIAFLLAEQEELAWFARRCPAAMDLGFGRDPLRALRRLAALVNRPDAALVHTHSFQPGVWARLFGSRGRAAVLSTIHSPYPYFLGRTLPDRIKAQIETTSINRAGRPVVAISEAVQRHLLANTDIDPRLIRVVRNGLDTMAPEAEPAPDLALPGASGRATDARTVIAVARLSREKGVDILLQAWPEVVRAHPRLRLVVVGDGPEADALHELVRRTGSGESVTFAGYRPEVSSWLAGADVFVNPSRFEGLSMSILEAQVAGVPVVATAVGGVPEIIRDGETGTLVESENPAALAAAIGAVLARPEEARRMAEAGRRRVAVEFDIRRTVRSYEEIYREVLAAPDGRCPNGGAGT